MTSGDAILVLADDVTICAVSDLHPDVRGRLDDCEGAYVVSRPRSRSGSLVLDPAAAALATRFREPQSMIAAVIALSEQTGSEPHAVLEAAFPVFDRLIRGGMLVGADSDARGTVAASLAAGDRVGGCHVRYAVQIVEDVEVYQAATDDGRRVALKIARPDAPPATGGLLVREAAVLRALAGRVGPRLEQAGEHDGRPYLASAWHDGVDAAEASARLRAIGDRRAHRELRALTLAIVEAYARLHAAGVLHGDVHPRNVLVGAGSTVSLLDFGLARRLGEPATALPRRGVGFYFEPEYARARVSGRAPPAVTARGEQYAVGALIYRLLAGTHYVDFRLDDGLWQQIAELAPVPLQRRGLPSWSAGDRVLGRALAKDPAERFATLAAFERELRRACEDDRGRGHASAWRIPRTACCTRCSGA